MEVDQEQLNSDLLEICRLFNVAVVPKKFQVDFMAKAILGFNGFLLVGFVLNVKII